MLLSLESQALTVLLYMLCMLMSLPQLTRHFSNMEDWGGWLWPKIFYRSLLKKPNLPHKKLYIHFLSPCLKKCYRQKVPPYTCIIQGTKSSALAFHLWRGVQVLTDFTNESKFHDVHPSSPAVHSTSQHTVHFRMTGSLSLRSPGLKIARSLIGQN